MGSKYALTEKDLMESSVLPIIMEENVGTIEEQLEIYRGRKIKDDGLEVEDEEGFENEDFIRADVVDWLGFNPFEYEENKEYEEK